MKRMRMILAFVAVMSLALSCGGEEQPMTTIDPKLQHLADSILTSYVSSVRAESVYVIALGTDGRVLSLFSWAIANGQSDNCGAPFIRPAGLFQPVLIASAMADGTLTESRLPIGAGMCRHMSSPDSRLLWLRFATRDTLFGIWDGLALDSRYLTARAASSYESTESFERRLRNWFPHSISVIPINTTPQERERYFMETFLGETTMVPADELAAFYGALANHGRLSAPTTTAEDQHSTREIIPESVADSLTAYLRRITILPYSTSYVSGLKFSVAGKSGSLDVPTSDGDGILSTFVGTFDLFGHGPVTLLVSITLHPGYDRPYSSSQRVFERVARCIWETCNNKEE